MAALKNRPRKKDKNPISSRKVKDKAAHPADKEILDESELERRYIVDRFYDLRSMHAAFNVSFFVLHLFLFWFLPGARYAASVTCCFNLYIVVLSRYIVRYRGTQHEERAKELFVRATCVAHILSEILIVHDDSLASEEGRRAHVAMVFLAKYFLAVLMIRISVNPKAKHWYGPLLPLAIFPAIAMEKPRYGIFPPGYEALAFFVSLGLGFLIGSVIDEMSWRHYLSMHKKDLEVKRKTKELTKSNRKYEMAMEALSSYNDHASFFEVR